MSLSCFNNHCGITPSSGPEKFFGHVKKKHERLKKEQGSNLLGRNLWENLKLLEEATGKTCIDTANLYMVPLRIEKNLSIVPCRVNKLFA